MLSIEVASGDSARTIFTNLLGSSGVGLPDNALVVGLDFAFRDVEEGVLFLVCVFGVLF